MTEAAPGGEGPPPATSLASLRARPRALLVLALLYGATLAWAWQAVPQPAPWLAASVLLAGVLVVLSVIDLDTYRLPDVLTLPLTLAGLGATWWLGSADPLWHGLAAAGGFLGLFAVNEGYRALRGRSGLGGGDAKLAAAGGAWLGPEGLLAMLLWGCLLALAAVGLALLAGRRLKADDRIPFGPFLALGFWLAWLAGPAT